MAAPDDVAHLMRRAGFGATEAEVTTLSAMTIAEIVDQLVDDVITPDEQVVVVGSGGAYAQAAAIALLRHTEMGAEKIAKHALQIAADIDIYTSGNMTVLTVGETKEAGDGDTKSREDDENRDDDETSEDDGNDD